MGLFARLRAAFGWHDSFSTWRDHARQRGLWPLTGSFETLYALTPEGEVVASNFVDFRELLPVDDARERNWLLHDAATRYPELAHLAPHRRPGDPDCPHCEGTGTFRAKPPGADNLLCYCGGLGWLPAGYVDPYADGAV